MELNLDTLWHQLTTPPSIFLELLGAAGSTGVWLSGRRARAQALKLATAQTQAAQVSSEVSLIQGDALTVQMMGTLVTSQQVRLDSTEARMTRIEGENTRITGENIRLQEQVLTLLGQIAVLDAEVKVLRSENQGYASQIATLTQERESLTLQVSVLQRRLDRLGTL